MAIHSKVSKAKIENGVRNLEPFNLNGTLIGERFDSRFPHNDSFRREVNGATYVIRSYAQPVVWFKDGEWFATERKWSVTTTNHTSNARMAVYYATGAHATSVA
jgi:hypothetical protein